MHNDLEKEAGAYVLRSYGEFFKKQYQDFNYHDEHSSYDNKCYSPIQVIMEYNELLPIPDLVSSDNTMMTKVLGVMSSLCVEIVKLKQEAVDRYFNFLSLYEEYNSKNISLQMDMICQMNAFVVRSNETLSNICSQLFALNSEGVVNLNGIQLHYIFNHTGEAFTILILIELLISNTSLPSNWDTYCKKIASYSMKPEVINLTEEKYQAITGALNNITAKLMNDDIVQNTLQMLTATKKRFLDKNNALVASEFAQYVKQAIANLDKLIQEKPSVNNMYKCIKINSLFVLCSHLFGNMDKSTFRSLMELNTKAHSIHVIGTTIWFPEQFLNRNVPSLCANNSRMLQTMIKARQAFISAKKSSISRDLVTLRSLCTQWALKVEMTFSTQDHKLSAAEMSSQVKLLLDGLELASNINFTVLTVLNLHACLSVPLSKSMLKLIIEIVNLLKCLENSLTRNYNQIINSVNMITQHLMFQTTASVLEVKKTLMTDKNYANKRLDELTCLVIAERCLRGAVSLERIVATNIALSFVPSSTYTEDSYVKLNLLLEKIQTLSSFMTSMKNFCNCRWMLWHQHIVPIYFEQNLSVQLDALKIRYFLMVLDDCARLLHKTDKFYQINKYNELVNKVENIIRDNLLYPTAQNVETNLRLHIHSHLQLDVTDPFTTDIMKKLLLAIDTLKIQNIYMSVVSSVEHYLSTTYYNLTTVVLSDWKTYGEMRQMARFKFNLKTVQDNLPTQTLEQGLDVLEIMRNIHIFVSKYNYNLNNQIFIEKSSNNKHLNSINIRHVANSIRTHGTGIMNTTVNFTYQFLKKKFFAFSQFMYDEHIKSRLNKDLRNFKERSDVNEPRYPFTSAEKFNKGIKVLGLAEDGQSYLDLFRDLISQIGNAMGYVRMIRTGGRHCCSDATVYLHKDLQDDKTFKELIKDTDFSPITHEAADNLDRNIEELITNFIQGTEYFQLLIDVFAPVFRNPKNIHLKNFFIIVPPLTFNFVEHMILCKDKMSKKNKVGAAFTDDGFAMGVAYILKLLDQDAAFESLHWFDSVWKHIANERSALEAEKSKGSIQLQQALALTEKKLKTLEEEYQLLYYSLSSARIFFR